MAKLDSETPKTQKQTPKLGQEMKKMAELGPKTCFYSQKGSHLGFFKFTPKAVRKLNFFVLFRFHVSTLKLIKLRQHRGNSIKSDVHFGHFEGLYFYCQWWHLCIQVCMMCIPASTTILPKIRVVPRLVLQLWVKIPRCRTYAHGMTFSTSRFHLQISVMCEGLQ